MYIRSKENRLSNLKLVVIIFAILGLIIILKKNKFLSKYTEI